MWEVELHRNANNFVWNGFKILKALEAIGVEVSYTFSEPEQSSQAEVTNSISEIVYSPVAALIQARRLFTPAEISLYNGGNLFEVTNPDLHSPIDSGDENDISAANSTSNEILVVDGKSIGVSVSVNDSVIFDITTNQRPVTCKTEWFFRYGSIAVLSVHIIYCKYYMTYLRNSTQYFLICLYICSFTLYYLSHTLHYKKSTKCYFLIWFYGCYICTYYLSHR